ncbi:hypothetical protein WJX84_004821 [Apatococcus fuscideae]|uniref:18S rRNA (Guanine-N(7))-methyltransferase n=1 Tax=Apatococcus fuscideae TaxID=2026836 RepID=A0AAW1T567_9CHLO
MVKGERPEFTNPPEIFYNDSEARKYTTSSRMENIQEALTQRALELLALPDDDQVKMLLDVGCGSGLSGQALSEKGHVWMGFDISAAMLNVALEREAEGDLCLHDIGQGLPLRAGKFDGAISISAIQWLCNADTKAADPRKRMRAFFESLYGCLARGARAVLQFYPQNSEQAHMLTSAAMRAGFSGGLVVDFPHSTRAKKYFLVLMVGSAAPLPTPEGLDGEEPVDDGQVNIINRKQQKRRKTNHAIVMDSSRHPEAKGKSWIFKKKDQMRKKGYTTVPPDTRYTGRKRKSHF